jgi:hypothetical protein
MVQAAGKALWTGVSDGKSGQVFSGPQEISAFIIQKRRHLVFGGWAVSWLS